MVDTLGLILGIAVHPGDVQDRDGARELMRRSLSRFLDDGRIEIDTNTVERTMRPIALEQKNHLFADSDGGARTWAIVASVIQSAKLNDIEPSAYLRDILEHIA